jgi:hypothetical protein
VAIEWTSKTVYVLEFKRTSDQRQDSRERGECRARDQHDVLVKSLETVIYVWMRATPVLRSAAAPQLHRRCAAAALKYRYHRDLVSQIPVSPRYRYLKNPHYAAPLRGRLRRRGPSRQVLASTPSPNIRRCWEKRGWGILKTRCRFGWKKTFSNTAVKNSALVSTSCVFQGHSLLKQAQLSCLSLL